MQYMLKRWCRFYTTALPVAGIVLMATVGLLITANGAVAANGIMLQIKDAPLKEVVMLLMQQSGTNIVIADESKLEKKVTASLNDVPLDKALDYIVASAGVSCKKMEDGTYIIGGITEESVLSKSDVAAALPPVEIAPVAEPSREVRIVTIKLQHSSPSELLAALTGSNSGVVVDPAQKFYDTCRDRMAPQVDTSESKGGVYLNSRDQTLDLRNGVHMQNNQPMIPTIDPRSLNPGAGRTGDVSTGAGQYDGGFIRPPGFAGGRNSGNNTNTPANSSSSNSNSSNFLWPEGVDDARPFDLDNSIIVKGTEDGIENFKKVIRMLDVPPKQVQIKAEFVEVSTSDVKSFGINWSLQRLNESFATTFTLTGDVVFALATGNLTANLQAQLTNNVGRVINSPIISTINNQMAMISINTVIPYWVSIATVVGDGQVINQATPNFISVDTQLAVLPRVNGDGTITMMLMPQVANAGESITGPDGTSIPKQSQQVLTTTRRVANGETIVVGGFIHKSDTNNIQKIPILADLPIVGSLFRTVAKKTDDSELLIFVTPTIIPDHGSGTVGGGVTP